jgi:antitoxin component YwqK of YwqJK toxin-antitoxin module
MKKLKIHLSLILLTLSGVALAQRDTVIFEDDIKLCGKIDNKNRKIGKWTAYNASGTKVMELPFVNDEVVGNIKKWDKKGRMVEDYYVSKDGSKEGKYKSWDYEDEDNDCTIEIGQYKDDEQDGKWLSTNSKNIILKEDYYSEGTSIGESKAYYPSQKLRSIGSYVNGTLHGEWKYYYEDGNLEMIRDHNSKKNSCDISIYYPNKKIKSKGQELNYMKIGVWYFYDEDGTKSSQDYKNGEAGNTVSYYRKNGSLDYTKEVDRHAGVVKFVYYDSSGAVKSTSYTTKAGKRISGEEYKATIKEMYKAF